MIEKLYLLSRNRLELSFEILNYKDLKDFPSNLDLEYEKYLDKQEHILEKKYEQIYGEKISDHKFQKITKNPYTRVLQKTEDSIIDVSLNPERQSEIGTLGLSREDWNFLFRIAEMRGILAARKESALIQNEKMEKSDFTKRQIFQRNKYSDIKQIRQPSSVIKPYLIKYCLNCRRKFLTFDPRQKYCFPGCKKEAFIEKRRNPHQKRTCPYCPEDISDRRSDAVTCGKPRCRKKYYRKKGAVRKVRR
jgi:hypothetical protein